MGTFGSENGGAREDGIAASRGSEPVLRYRTGRLEPEVGRPAFMAEAVSRLKVR
jgi:hypothetical protein